jgi:short subunit dehydrogenase-like uncharacterized protein
MRDVDILIYGATGFTGRCVALELASQLSTGAEPPVSWAVGGRSAGRLGLVAAEVAAAHPGAPPPAVIVADAQADRRKALGAALGRARVVVNCAGPFARLGGLVVQACIDAACDYVDISGEPGFILRVMLEEDARARAAGCLIVSACGFDSVPAELGCLFASNALRDVVDRSDGGGGGAGARQTTHIESFMRFTGGRVGGHVTTLECALAGFQSADETRRVRRALPATGEEGGRRPPAPKVRTGIFREPRASPRTGGADFAPYVTLFPGSDSTIVKQTLRIAAAGRSKIPEASRWHSYSTYVVVGSAATAVALAAHALLLYIVNALPGGPALILRYPHVFTNNLFTRDGPSAADRAATSVAVDFYGTRYVGDVKRAEVTTRCSLTDPGYGATARIVLAAARTILDDRHNMPDGGVMTPAAAFAGTGLLGRLVRTNALRLDVLHERAP